MVSSCQRLHWLVIAVPMTLGLPLLANANMMTTQLLDTENTFDQAIFDNAFIDSVTEGCEGKCAMDFNPLTVMQFLIWPRSKEEGSSVLPGIDSDRAGGNVLGGVVRHGIGLMLLENRAGNSTNRTISGEMTDLLAKKSPAYCWSLNLGPMRSVLDLKLSLIVPLTITINRKNSPSNFSCNENPPVSCPYPSTGHCRFSLCEIATACQQGSQQGSMWPTRQSTNSSPAQYRCGAVDEGSSANARHTKV
jgi:hypothetical protein